MKKISISDVLIEDDNIIHDSTKEVFRSPAGAVKSGSEITLSLKPSGIRVEEAVLCVMDGGAVERLSMKSSSPPGEEFSITAGHMLCVTYKTPRRAGGSVLWYWFEIHLEGGAVFYYGAENPWPSGLGRIYQNPPPGFQITVYDKDFDTPDWAKSAVMYQIFPDRFETGDPERVRAGIEYHRNKGRTEIELHKNWDDIPVFEARDGQKFYMPGDIFGGDLEGIRNRIPYLKSLGINLIYLNPIFESASNHRYNTGDYMKIDPILGDESDFKRLVSEAGEAGIRIILDGVFSHTGDDSIYFNKYGRYDDEGAYQSQDSPYFGWYRFDDWPDKYESWWGFETLPEVDEENPGWQEFMITGQKSIVKHWLGKGASGYRLDVADELPDETIEQIRRAVKEADPEALLIGEVWDDATTKQSYEKQRTYALGKGLDSVMNYPFLNQTIDFLKGKTDAWEYARFLNHQKHSYPAPMYYTLMNLMSSHDVCRMRSVLAKDFDAGRMSRAEQAVFELTEEEMILGGKRQRLAAAIQFSLPGIPAVYYGDEVGMTGLLDPFNRLTYRREDISLIEWYMELAITRNSYPVMSTGEVRFFSANGFILAILRYAADGSDHFGNKIKEPGSILTVINPTNEQHRIVLDLGEEMNSKMAENLFTSRVLPLEKGLIEIDMPPLLAEFYRLI